MLTVLSCAEPTDVLDPPPVVTPPAPPPPGPSGPSFPGFPGSTPIAPGFRANIYGAEWMPDSVALALDTNTGRLVITATSTSSFIRALKLTVETTALGTYSLVTGASSVTLDVTHGDTIITLTSTQWNGRGLVAVLPTSSTWIAGRFIGDADSPASSELFSFFGEFNLVLPSL